MPSDPFRRRQNEADPADGAEPLRGIAGAMRVACQVVGLIMILVGSYFLVQIVTDVWSFARDPSAMEKPLAAMVETIKLNAQPNENMPFDPSRAVAAAPLLFAYLVCAWICYLFLSGGARLVLGVVSERREFYAAMKEFLIALRSEETANRTTTPS